MTIFRYNTDMELVQIFCRYIVWHYTFALSDIFRLAGNYLWFVRNFFSMGLLARTLFSPWRRLTERGGRGTGESWFGAFIINSIMRLVGIIARSVTISAGLIGLLLTFLLAIGFFILWLFLPALVVFMFLAGWGYLIKSI